MTTVRTRPGGDDLLEEHQIDQQVADIMGPPPERPQPHSTAGLAGATPAERISEAMFHMMSAMDADDPSDVKPGMVIQAPSKEEPMWSAVTEVGGPGWKWLYNTITGERIRVNNANLREALKKVSTDPLYPEHLGKPLFSPRPTKKREYGQYRCMLYPGTEQCPACGEKHDPHPDYATYRAWGMPPCNGAHLPSPYEVERHMQMRHKSAWAHIQRNREEVRRREEREAQDAILRMLASRIAPAPDQEPAPQTQAQPAARERTKHNHRNAFTFQQGCPRCQELVAERATAE